MRKFGLTIATAALVAIGGGLASTGASASGMAHPPEQHYHFTGLFGTYDTAAAQRGLEVYAQVCSSCHSLDLIHFRDLAGLGYSEDQIKAFASTYTVQDGPNDDGEMFDRNGLAKDAFPSPYSNVKEAAAVNGGKAPPDLSLIVKSRAHGLGNIGLNFLDMLRGGEFASGASYITALVGHGYSDDPSVEDKMHCLPQNAEESHEDYVARLEAWEPSNGTHFNKWFPGCSIGMPNPLFEDAVEYTDGTKASPEQMAYDVSVFLAWASEPHLAARKQSGIAVLLFLAVFTGVMIAVKRQIWAGVKKH